MIDDENSLPLSARVRLRARVARARAQEPLVPNFDFSEGLKGWTAWSSNAQHPWSLDEAVGHAGKPSLRIEARNPPAM